MWNTIGATIIISWDDLFLEQAVQRKAVGLSLCIRIVVFTFLANRPAVLAVVALGPPAIEDTTIRLSIQGGFLTTRTSCPGMHRCARNDTPARSVPCLVQRLDGPCRRR